MKKISESESELITERDSDVRTQRPCMEEIRRQAAEQGVEIVSSMRKKARSAFVCRLLLLYRKFLRNFHKAKKPSGRDAHSRERKMLSKGNRARREHAACGMLFLYALIVLSFSTALGISLYSIQKKIPSKIYFFAGERQLMDFGMPATGEVEMVAGIQRSNIPEGAVTIDLSEPVTLMAKEPYNYRMNVRLFGLVPIKQVDIRVIENQKLIPVGIPVGIYMHSSGVLVIGVASFETPEGVMVSPSKNILYSGDYVIEANGVKTDTKDALMQVIDDSKGRSVELTVVRNGKSVKAVITPRENALHEYKAGIWVRDDLQGVGTLTFIDENGRFGALGHGITDVDTCVVMEVDGGSIYETTIVNLKRGTRGEPGEMTGQIVYDDRYILGSVEENSEKGVYGTCNPEILEFCSYPAMPIGLKQSVKTGPAQILCTVEDQPELYDVVITAAHSDREADTRGIELKVTDERLLRITGGIIQGMSGSPIIQDGRIVGAVTHVLVNTPEKGYGIFIENMLK